MPHHFPTYLVERQRMLSDLRTVTFPDPLPNVCRVCFTVQEDKGYHDRCLCEFPAWVPLDAVLHELNLQIQLKNEEHRAACVTISEGKVDAAG